MVNKSNVSNCLGVWVFLLSIAGLGKAATITVGPPQGGGESDFSTIQAGIDVAGDGDTVIVAPGEYIITEPITFRGKAITVRSGAGPNKTTIRMDTPADPTRASVVVFESSETTTSVLDGFTVTGGTGLWFPSAGASGGGGILFVASAGTVKNCSMVQNITEYGGGVGCAYPCSPRIEDCTIAENSAEQSGGGVFAYFGASPTLTDCILTNNSSGHAGGGIDCTQDSSMVLTNCIISENSVTGEIPHVSGYGGGLSCTENSLLTVIDCAITRNSAGVGSGGIHCYKSSVTLSNCLITENSAARIGGAMFCETDSSAVMTQCIVSGNSAGTWGGAIHCLDASLTVTGCEIVSNKSQQEGGGVECDGSSATFTNCTIAQNSALERGGGLIWCNGSSGVVTSSIVWGNTAPTGSDISLLPGSTLRTTYSDVAGGRGAIDIEGGTTLSWGVGNMDADPCFADPTNGRFHLKSQAGRWDPTSHAWVQDDVTSPCIDAGDPMSPIGWERFPNGGFINLGAYGGTSKASRSFFGEPICETIVAGDINGDGQVNQADLDIMALHWTDEEPWPLQ